MFGFNVIELTYEDKVAYMKTMFALAKVDGHVHKKELGYIAAQASLLGMCITDYISDNGKFAQIDYTSTSDLMKKSILRDLIVLAHIDGHYSESEKKLLITTAQDMGLEKVLVEKMEQWLKDYWHIIEEGKKIFAVQPTTQ